MIFADAHCDVLNAIVDKNEGLNKNTCRFSLDLIKKYDAFVQFFACFISPRFYDNPKARFESVKNKYFYEMEKSDAAVHCCSGSDLRIAEKSGKCAAFLTCESGEWIESTEDIEYAYSLGIRVIGLTWDNDNKLGCGAKTVNDSGLTSFGKNVVLCMNRLGICVDVTHLSDRSFFDACKLSDRPLFATHSNSRAVCPQRRNLTDEQFRLIAQSGGFVGINLYAPFLSGRNTATLSDVHRHIEHFLNIGGENNVGMGADFDGMEEVAEEIKNVSDLHKITEKLTNNAYDKSIIDKIAHKNLERVINFF